MPRQSPSADDNHRGLYCGVGGGKVVKNSKSDFVSLCTIPVGPSLLAYVIINIQSIPRFKVHEPLRFIQHTILSNRS